VLSLHSAGAMRAHDPGTARLVTCAYSACGRGFILCRSCDRGNKYCSKECATAARREYLVPIRRKHAASPEGLEDHRERMARYRDRLKQARRVTDLRRQKPETSCNVSPRSGPIVMETMKDAGAKAGPRVPPAIHTELSSPAYRVHEPHSLGVRCARCRRVVFRVHLEPPRRN
jgi:hypothetical protein